LGEEWLERRRQTADGEQVQQYVYVLEANLVFYNLKSSTFNNHDP
jgi:hypothetical protein